MNLSVFKIIADWTVWLYILIPTLVIGGVMYRSWWCELPIWSEGIPAMVYLLGALLLSWKGNFRSFLVDADCVFLLKHRNLVINVKSWGYTYTVIVSAIVVGAFTILILPLLFGNFSVSLFQMISFFVYFFGLKMMSTFLRSLKIGKLTERWQHFVFEGLLLFVLAFITGVLFYWVKWEGLFAVFGVTFVLMSHVLARSRVHTLTITDDELMIEKQEQLKWIHFIYNLAPELEKTKVISRKKPWFFRNSKQIFKRRTPVNGFVELFLKVMFRHSDYMLDYFRINMVTMVAMLAVPTLWLKLIIFCIFLFVLHSWLTSMWWKITLSQPQFYKYRDYEGYALAKNKALRIFEIPAVSLVLIVLLIVMNY